MKIDIIGTAQEKPQEPSPLRRSLRASAGMVAGTEMTITANGREKIYPVRCRSCQSLPILASSVHAGFPSPAEDYIEGSLDLNEHLIRHPAATFIVRVEGDSMRGAGIFPGDLLVVDRSVEPRDGHVVIAVVEGELTVKRLKGRSGQWSLVAEHPNFPPIHLNGGGEPSSIWGVVTSSVRRLDHGV